MNLISALKYNFFRENTVEREMSNATMGKQKDISRIQDILALFYFFKEVMVLTKGKFGEIQLNAMNKT